MAEGQALLRLLTWLSPAFPTGGFAYSHGLEWSVETGEIYNEATLIEWLNDILKHGSLWSDAILLRHAHRATAQEVPALVELAEALAPGAERRLETLAQGAAFRLAAKPWTNEIFAQSADAAWPYSIAVGVLAASYEVAENDAALAFLHAAVANMVSAAVRLIPLGQDAGLRVQAALETAVLHVVGTTATKTLDDLGGACWRSEIASMRHETQYTRLFRT